MLVSTIQNKRKLIITLFIPSWFIVEINYFILFIIGYYLKKKKNELENNLRVPPQNSPALQDRPPPSPQAQQDPPSPVEPSDEQVQIRPPEPRTDEQVQVRPPVEPSDEQVQIRPPEPRTDEQVQVQPPEPRTNEQVQSNPPKRVRKQRVNDKENHNNVPKKRGRKAKSSK
jgi:hypothetical protein